MYGCSCLMQDSPQADSNAEQVGVAWAEFVITSIDSLPTSKLINSEGIGGHSAEGAWGEHWVMNNYCSCPTGTVCLHPQGSCRLHDGETVKWKVLLHLNGDAHK